MNEKWFGLGISFFVWIVVILLGALFIVNNSWLGTTDSALLYLAGIVGAGCCWIGLSCRKD